MAGFYVQTRIATPGRTSNRVVLSWRVTYYKQVDPYEVNRNRLPQLRPERPCGNGRGRIYVSRAAIHISRRRRSCVISRAGGAFKSIEHSRSLVTLAETETKAKR